MSKAKIVYCFTELVRLPYKYKLASGLTFRGHTIVASVTKCSDGTNRYSDGEHNPITERQFDLIKQSVEEK